MDLTQFYYLASEIIENFAIRSFKRANFELETKLKQVELQCNQLNEQLDKEKHDLNITGDMLKGAMNQVVALSQELNDNRDMLAHSELDTSYYKKLGDSKIQKLEKEICDLSIIQNNLQSELAQINESLDTEALYTQHLKLEQESFELELKKKEETIIHQMNTIINMETKIHKIKPNVAHKPRNVRKHPCFKLIRKNNNDVFQYVTVRAQRSGVKRALKRIKLEYPTFKDCNGVTIQCKCS